MTTNLIQDRESFTILKAVTVFVFLLGCLFAGSSISDKLYHASTPVINTAVSKIYVNESTGKITKYVDPYGYVGFDEGYTSDDTLVESYPTLYVLGSGPFDETIEIDGKATTMMTDITWEYIEAAEFVPFFNDNIASDSYDTVAELKKLPIEEILNIHISSVVKDAIDDEALPSAQYTLSSKVAHFVDAGIAAAEASGVSAKDAFKQFRGEARFKGSTFRYDYSCTEYRPTLNGQATAEAVQALFAPDDVNHFSIQLYSWTVTTETATACDVVEVFTPTSKPGAPTPDRPADSYPIFTKAPPVPGTPA